MTSSSGVDALLAADAGERGGDAVVVVLRPALERMVVALGALDANAEEQLGRRFGRVAAGRGWPASSWRPGSRTRCRWRSAVRGRTGRAACRCGSPRKSTGGTCARRPRCSFLLLDRRTSPHFSVQNDGEIAAVDAVGRSARSRLSGLVSARNACDLVDASAAGRSCRDTRGGGTLRRCRGPTAGSAAACSFSKTSVIDEVVRRRVVPGKARHVFQKRDVRRWPSCRGSGRGSAVSPRPSLSTRPLSSTVATDSFDELKTGQRGHVADAAVAESAQHDESAGGRASSAKTRLLGQHLDLHEVRHVGRVELQSFGDPVVQNGVRGSPL